MVSGMVQKTDSVYWRIFTVFGIMMLITAIGQISRVLRVVTLQELPAIFILGLLGGISLIIVGVILRKKSANT